MDLREKQYDDMNWIELTGHQSRVGGSGLECWLGCFLFTLSVLRFSSFKCWNNISKQALTHSFHIVSNSLYTDNSGN
jgi:hypothetical protein